MKQHYNYSHSNDMSIYNFEGELMHQQEVLGVNSKETIQTILELIN